MNFRTVIVLTACCVIFQFASAADIRVDKKAWDSLSSDQRAAIEKNLTKNRLLLHGDKIVGVEGAAGAGAWDPGCDFKRVLCDGAAVAAAAECAGVPICLAVVAAARDECRKC